MSTPLQLVQRYNRRHSNAAWEILNEEDGADLSSGKGYAALVHHIGILLPGLYQLHVPSAFEYEGFEVEEIGDAALARLKGIADLDDPQMTIKWILDTRECEGDTELSEILDDLIAEMYHVAVEEISRCGVMVASPIVPRR